MNAQEKYLATSAQIDEQLHDIRELVLQHIPAHPDQVHWGHVGDLQRVSAQLQEIIDSLNDEE